MVRPDRPDLEQVPEQNKIPFRDALTDSFMRRYTDFTSYEAFFDESPWAWDTPRLFQAIPDDALSAYVADHTHFSSWREMEDKATLQWLDRWPAEQRPTVADALTPRFMQTYTDYPLYRAFFADRGWSAETPDQFRAIPDKALDRHVEQTTDFGSWKEMDAKAALQWFDRRLREGFSAPAIPLATP